MKKSIRTILSLAAIGCTLAPAATADNTVQAAIESIDRIVGVRQESAPPLGYEASPASQNDLIGVTGSLPSLTRYCRNTVVRFTLPTLPPGMVVRGAALNYEIRESRTHSGTDFDAHVYLLDTANPDDSGVGFYYSGPEDSNVEVVFVGSTEIPHVGTDNVTHDPPIAGSHTLEGPALLLLQSFYDGGTPAQPEAFFRFNRSNPSPEGLDGAALDRYHIDIGAGKVTLTITYSPPPRDIQSAVQSKDSIVGATQDEGLWPLGYYPDGAENSTVGTAGATGQRRDRVAVVGFALPTLPSGSVVVGATLGFKITHYRSDSGEQHDADAYLLDTNDPDDSGTDFYYLGPADPSSDVAFVGRTVLSEAGTAEVVYDPPIAVSHTLFGNALTRFESFYDGHEPTQSEAFFRFNRSNEIALSRYDRYRISMENEELSLTIHYLPPRGTVVTLR